jgi:glycosyltransferase involved in cell wall biosynthesis
MLSFNMLALIIVFLACRCAISYPKNPIEFVIIVPSYNNQQWYKKNLDSIAQQTYPHFEIIYVNDCSTDKTRELVEQYRKQSPLKNRIKTINQPMRGGPLASQYTAIHQCPDHKVIVLVDGDDMLNSPTALQKLAKIYANKNIWLTYGSYIDSLTKQIGAYCKAYPPEAFKYNTFRYYGFRASHLKTFYAKLFKKIKLRDLQYQGLFYPAAGDVAFMFPMLEMASQGHIKFIKKPLYIWNNDNPINEHKDRTKAQHFYGTLIAKKQTYRPLKSLFKEKV